MKNREIHFKLKNTIKPQEKKNPNKREVSNLPEVIGSNTHKDTFHP